LSAAVPAFSLVILCYRAEEYARDFVGRVTEVLEEAGVQDYELILVANYLEGVEDRTPGIVAELAAGDPRIRHVARRKEGWMGWDMRCGLEMARGEVVGVIDGDGQMPASDVPILYKLLKKERYDLVKTFRITRGDGLVRRLISNVYNKMFHLLFPGLQARDMNSKPKLLTRAAYAAMKLTSDDWFIDAEIMIEARRLKLRIGEVPTGFLGLTGRRSFVSLKAVFEFLRNLVRYRLREWSR
jgi:glycosyltransferase involved in cell wall biosynthesis